MTLLVIVILLTAILFAYPLRYKKTIIQYANEFDLDPVLIASVIHTESKFRSDAQSNKGAIGLMQLLPTTAEYIAKKNNITEFNLLDPEDNILLGVMYLRYLYDRFRCERIALVAYNAGEGNVAKWLAVDPELNNIPYRETRDYLKRVTRAKRVYRFRV